MFFFPIGNNDATIIKQNMSLYAVAEKLPWKKSAGLTIATKHVFTRKLIFDFIYFVCLNFINKVGSKTFNKINFEKKN